MENFALFAAKSKSGGGGGGGTVTSYTSLSNKPEIIEYLNVFIKRNGKRQNMEEAVRRWNEDLRWVREYRLNRQRHFEISNIHKNK